MSGERYRDLGLRPVINASATLTRLGGSLMPEPVLDAMRDAAGQFVDLPELQERVGARLAELTGNEAGYVSSGAAAGITLAVAACIAGNDPELVDAFPYLEGIERREVVIHRSQRNGYDYAARQTGAPIVEVEGRPGDLERAISSRTACVLWFAGAHYAEGALPIERVVEIAHARGVPVLVDAAAQVPPISSLWRFTRDAGADAVMVSGGKGLRGPQSSGLVLGRRELIEGCRANGSPNHSIGRPMKVGKEELMGLLAAVELALEKDEEALIAGYEASVRRWIDGLAGLPGVFAERVYPSEAGQPHGRAVVRFGMASPWSRDAVVEAMWGGDPRIAVGTVGDDAIALNPQTLEPGQDVIVLEALRRLLASAPPAN
jgi:uncharacterized pyridoxal phosphate-dependent enzyme